MKQFLKTVFASMLGTFLCFGLMFFVFVAMIVGAVSSKKSSWESDLGVLKDKSVLYIEFDGPVVDHMQRRDIFSSIMKYDEPPLMGLFEIGETLKAAAKDDKIEGLLLNFKNFESGLANTEALRREVVEFKKSGKFVLAYAEVYSELAYMVASAADEVILYPKGFFEWDGLYSKLGYFKNTMTKLDVVPQVFRVGKYKSAIEPFISDKMSPESREQVDAIISGVWDQILTYSEEKSKLSKDDLNSLAENMAVVYANQAHEKGFVNLLGSFEEVEKKLLELTGVKDKPNYSSWRTYYRNQVQSFSVSKKDKIAILFASGEIRSDSGDGQQISSEELTDLIHEIRQDKDVKAVVMRVNSPGGSALASDVIWTSTQWLKDDKPLVTSFGNVAASGGYYMSAGSQYIFAEATTVTGSIGVFGLSFATEKFWNGKVGMTFDTAKSHKFADLEALVRPFNPEEMEKMQNFVDTIYEDFLKVVTDGREKLETRDQTHEIAQGRVWLGQKALELGLVDEIGGLNEAVAKAAELAKVSDYSLEVYPRERSAIEEFMHQFGDVSTKILQSFVPEALQTLIKTKTQNWRDNVYTRLPIQLDIK